MSAAHTPGPWVAHPSHQKGRAAAAYYIDRVGGGDKRSRAVAHVKNSTIQPTAANARLIAAAPELLETLQQIDRAYESIKPYSECPPRPDGMHDVYGVRHMVRAAIAKATGEQP